MSDFKSGIVNTDLHNFHCFITLDGQDNHNNNKLILFSKLTSSGSGAWILSATNGRDIWQHSFTSTELLAQKDDLQLSFEKYFTQIKQSCKNGQTNAKLEQDESLKLNFPSTGKNTAAEPIVLAISKMMEEDEVKDSIGDILFAIARKCNDAIRRADAAVAAAEANGNSSLLGSGSGSGGSGGSGHGRHHRGHRKASEAFRDDDGSSSSSSSSSSSLPAQHIKRRPGYSLINPSVHVRQAKGIKFGPSVANEEDDVEKD